MNKLKRKYGPKTALDEIRWSVVMQTESSGNDSEFVALNDNSWNYLSVMVATCFGHARYLSIGCFSSSGKVNWSRSLLVTVVTYTSKGSGIWIRFHMKVMEEDHIKSYYVDLSSYPEEYDILPWLPQTAADDAIAF